jgi:hypothetical protein
MGVRHCYFLLKHKVHVENMQFFLINAEEMGFVCRNLDQRRQMKVLTSGTPLLVHIKVVRDSGNLLAEVGPFCVSYAPYN